MISKSKVKFVRSLHLKKNREEEGLFIAEGEKIVEELLNSSFQVHSLYCTQGWLDKNKIRGIEADVVSENELKQLSALVHPNEVLAVIHIPQKTFSFPEIENSFSFLLDKIQDPGNMGTLLRIADWFGISTIICSEECVEVFNPKVIQASMGSCFRVHAFSVSLGAFLKKTNPQFPVIGTLLDGQSIYQSVFPPAGLILFGNESQGISPDLLPYITQKISIPRASEGKAESLNVAVAAGIVCAEIMRNGSL